jgi:hypothetical protein
VDELLVLVDVRIESLNCLLYARLGTLCSSSDFMQIVSVDAFGCVSRRWKNFH